MDLKLLFFSARREEQRSPPFLNRVLRTIYAPKREEITGGQRNCLIRNLNIFVQHMLGRSNQEERYG
jgi:hypothetical protein